METFVLFSEQEGSATSSVISPRSVEVLLQTYRSAGAGVLTVEARVSPGLPWFTVTTVDGTAVTQLQAYPEMRVTIPSGSTYSAGLREMLFSSTAVTWSSIPGKPTEFLPEAHTHVKADITDLSLAWSDITGKPSTFTPSTHTHVRADITDFTHTHTTGDITGLGTAATRNTGTSGTVIPLLDAANSFSANQTITGTNQLIFNTGLGLVNNSGQLKVTNGSSSTAALACAYMDVSYINSSNGYWQINGDNGGMLFKSDLGIRWSSTSGSGGSKDCGISRASAGVVKINDGSTGDGSLTLLNLTHKGTTVGFYNVTPTTRQTLAAAATDAATTQTLANDIRSKLITLGLCQ